jgi:putative spermidine/putrescine transport system ATP-binding protein
MKPDRGHALAIERISHRFGAMLALDDVSLAIQAGELIALLGPSGCGKTTLLRIIAGFIRPSEGDIRVDGARVNDVPANRRNVGIVFQNYALFPHLSVFENVAYGLRARGAPKAQVAARVDEMLRLVQMRTFADRLPGQLSGGQQQRIALARALAIEPSIVLLDEPFSALDKNLRLDMQIEIKGLLKAYGLTSIIVTHDQEEALSMADRIVVLNAGRIEQIDAPERLYDRPQSLFVNRFVGQTNLLPGVVAGGAEGRLAVRLNAGAVIEARTPRGDLREGASVLVSVRPENLAIAQSNDPGAMPATVRLTLPLGPVEVIEAALGDGASIKLTRPRSPSNLALQPGSAVAVAVADPAGVAVFAAPDSVEPPTSALVS